MADPETGQRWRPTLTTLIAGGIVLAGFALTGVSWWFFVLVAVGTFGPGVLRELGWLHDKDEFQRRADHQAGYHAFLATGLMAAILVAFFRSGERTVEHTDRLATLVLVLLWFTWFLSSMLAYWGPQRGAAWILRVFGAVVLAFTIVSNLGPEWTGWAALLLHPLLAAPFFILAWLSSRWPRVAGVLLLAAGLALLPFFSRSSHLALITQGVTLVWFVAPLLASGLALLVAGESGDEPEDPEERQAPSA